MTSPKPGTKRSPKRNHHDDDQQRVILLLDMDCFYAQCESVRLGLDPDIPLALIQMIKLPKEMIYYFTTTTQGVVSIIFIRSL
eukprot:scaffold110690_cov50-Cyclotella_meneghiniana.AAC.1